VLGHGGQENHGIDVRTPQEFTITGIKMRDVVERGFRAMPFRAAQGDELDPTLALEFAHDREVSLQDVAATGEGEAHR